MTLPDPMLEELELYRANSRVEAVSNYRRRTGITSIGQPLDFWKIVFQHFERFLDGSYVEEQATLDAYHGAP